MARTNGSFEKRHLIIGLDFGTTYTGVAYCDSSVHPDDVNSIQIVHNWPGSSGNATKEKVPSQIAYGNFQDGETSLWGGLIPPNVSRHVWLKLKLDETSSKREKLPGLWRLIRGEVENPDIVYDDAAGGNDNPHYPGKEPVDMITDYLRDVNNHVLKVLNEQFTPPMLRTMIFKVVVTVPAVWSDRAKDLTLRAVKGAGFGPYDFQVSMVAEPEAAAIYALKALKLEAGSSDNIQVGDHFVLCDAGGGTVDLISYKVCSVSPHFEVKEAAVGTGDKCGSTFVDRNFKSWLRGKLGATDYRKIKKEKLMFGSKIMNEFEVLKTAFTGTRPQGRLTLPRELRIEDDPARQIEDGEILVTAKDLRKMFDPHIDRTLELIDGQVSKVMAKGGKVKYVLLVGGFGSSDYMFQKVQKYATARGIETRRPPFPWSSVVRGAVARGMETDGNQLVGLRLCRRHYGTPLSVAFDGLAHIAQDAYIDKFTGMRMASSQMEWLLAKGDALSSQYPKHVSIDCTYYFFPSGSRMFSLQLAACDDNNAPQRFRETAVYNVCTLNVDLISVPLSKFRSARRPNGEVYFIADFKIEIIAAGPLLRFRAMFDGKEYGSVEAKYDP